MQRSRGFSLLEMLVVLLIVGLFSALGGGVPRCRPGADAPGPGPTGQRGPQPGRPGPACRAVAGLALEWPQPRVRALAGRAGCAWVAGRTVAQRALADWPAT
ncbi:pilus assembly FimT family protein [Pseudomonas hygromyciniae]|uniref:pilus assembly FimT family protein n=1 Tax=Pseudomonas hygromyciniae TaxID=2812000 RepID=UPI00287FF522|nr:prepilin-type N-terminal cleavage/methylation domain-containing protein [Pseudomonas hygromyciniae]